MRHSDSHPLLMCHFQTFNKIDSFLKNVSNILDEEPFNLHIIVGQLFFLFHWEFQEKIEPSSRNFLFEQQTEVAEYTEYTYYFLIGNCSNARDFLNWSFCFIFDCMNSVNCRLKKLINEQIIIFYSPSNYLTNPYRYSKTF